MLIVYFVVRFFFVCFKRKAELLHRSLNKAVGERRGQTGTLHKHLPPLFSINTRL